MQCVCSVYAARQGVDYEWKTRQRVSIVKSVAPLANHSKCGVLASNDPQLAHPGPLAVRSIHAPAILLLLLLILLLHPGTLDPGPQPKPSASQPLQYTHTKVPSLARKRCGMERRNPSQKGCMCPGSHPGAGQVYSLREYSSSLLRNHSTALSLTSTSLSARLELRNRSC